MISGDKPLKVIVYTHGMRTERTSSRCNRSTAISHLTLQGARKKTHSKMSSLEVIVLGKHKTGKAVDSVLDIKRGKRSYLPMLGGIMDYQKSVTAE